MKIMRYGWKKTRIVLYFQLMYTRDVKADRLYHVLYRTEDVEMKRINTMRLVS